MIDRYLIRYFLAVIDQGNFSKAAAMCNVSQPTLSVGIAKLENLLGATLFARTNRRVELTAAGARFATHARAIESGFAAAEGSVRDAGAPVTFRIGILTTIPTAWQAQLAMALRRAPAEERVELVEGRERDLAEQLGRGRLDLAITVLRETERRFHAEPLYREDYGLALPRDHRLAGESYIEGEALAADVMLVRRNCEALPEISRYFTARGVRPFFSARTTNDDRAVALVRAGFGVTVLPRSHDAPAFARLIGLDLTRTIALVTPPDARLDDRIAPRIAAETMRQLGETLGEAATAV